MATIATRLTRLEQRVGGDDEEEGCPVCGPNGSDPCGRRLLMWDDPPPGPCPSCGVTPIVFTMKIGDMDPRERLADRSNEEEDQ